MHLRTTLHTPHHSFVNKKNQKGEITPAPRLEDNSKSTILRVPQWP